MSFESAEPETRVIQDLEADAFEPAFAHKDTVEAVKNAKNCSEGYQILKEQNDQVLDLIRRKAEVDGEPIAAVPYSYKLYLKSTGKALAKAGILPDLAVEWAKENSNKIDIDGDGNVAYGELVTAETNLRKNRDLKKETNNRLDRIMVDSLQSGFPNLKTAGDANPAGISRADLNEVDCDPTNDQPARVMEKEPVKPAGADCNKQEVDRVQDEKIAKIEKNIQKLAKLVEKPVDTVQKPVFNQKVYRDNLAENLKAGTTLDVKRGDSYWRLAARNLGLDRKHKCNHGKIATEMKRLQKLNGFKALRPGEKISTGAA